MNKVTQAIVLDKVMNNTKLYMHSFRISAEGDDEKLFIYVDIILQDKSPIVTDLTGGKAWLKVLPILKNLNIYLHNVKAHVNASDGSYELDIYDFNELHFDNTNIMIKAISVFTMGQQIGTTYFYDEEDFTPVVGEQIDRYGIYDVNKGKEVYFTEI